MTIKVFIYILMSVFLSASAQITLKVGMMRYKLIADHVDTVLQKVWLISTNLYVIAGLGMYALGAVIWLAVLVNIDVSKAYPFVGLGFIFTMVLAYFILGEEVNMLRIIGAIQVIIGVLLISKT